MKHGSLFLVPLILVSLSAQADVLSSGCSAGQVAVGSAVNGATGINSRCSAANSKQRVENAVNNPAGYAKGKAAQASGVDDAYRKARSSKQRVENAVNNPAGYAKGKAAQASGVDDAYRKARSSKQRVENAVDNPGRAAARRLVR